MAAANTLPGLRVFFVILSYDLGAKIVHVRQMLARVREMRRHPWNWDVHLVLALGDRLPSPCDDDALEERLREEEDVRTACRALRDASERVALEPVSRTRVVLTAKELRDLHANPESWTAAPVTLTAVLQGTVDPAILSPTTRRFARATVESLRSLVSDFSDLLVRDRWHVHIHPRARERHFAWAAREALWDADAAWHTTRNVEQREREPREEEEDDEEEDDKEGQEEQEQNARGGTGIVEVTGSTRVIARASRPDRTRPHAGETDVFVFFEDDHDVTAAHIAAHVEWSRPGVLPGHWISGRLQFEHRDPQTVDNPAARLARDDQRPHLRHLIGGALFHNDAYAVYRRGGRAFLVPQNVHEAGFILTRAQWTFAVGSGCVQRRARWHWSYQTIEAADTEPFFRCGWTKVIPLPDPVSDRLHENAASDGRRASGSGGGGRPDRIRLEQGGEGGSARNRWEAEGEMEDGASTSTRERASAAEPLAMDAWRAAFLIHHLPDKYVWQDGVERSDQYLLTDDRLFAWMARCVE